MRKLFTLMTVLAGFCPFLHAEEGMWLYTNLPTRDIKEKYNIDITPEWLEHLQKASVRFGKSGSASFVSPDGLVMTNHHVGVGILEKLSTKEKDFVKNGFYAETREEEIKCPDVELNVLQKIEDVTPRVNAAVKGQNMSQELAEKNRRLVISEIESEAEKATGMKCTVSAFFEGGLYHLYYYRKYDDVRLVFAPESALGFFGGDPDNYEFPRYCLDVTFFRAYENNVPAKTEHYLKWSENGAAENELVFVSGHPGRTDRLKTVAHLKFLRDTVHPFTLEKIYRKEVISKAFGEQSEENMRRIHTDIFRWTNYRKRYNGILLGLQDQSFMAQKEKAEQELRWRTPKRAIHSRDSRDPWHKVEEVIDQWKSVYHRHDLLETGSGFNSQIFSYARQIVRLAQEQEKPDAERLKEYQGTAVDTVKQAIQAEMPLFQDIEILKLTDSLGLLTDKLGADTPLVKVVLDGKSPLERATELIQNTSLFDPESRKALMEGGLAAVNTSDDPMIQLVLLIDSSAREYRKIMEIEIDEPLQQAYGEISDIRFRTYGTSVYPDATFTLRLSYGQVKGYTETDGSQIPAMTCYDGLYARADEHHQIEPFALPERWLNAKPKVRLQTPMNFLTTHDIVGGNSGSPMVNAKGEVVGLVFDGNINSLVLNFIYDDQLSRTVSVHSSAIMEALKSVYSAERLVRELLGK
ncbi:MAG: S46 family peptidase [Planctomycetaceae bacterium]|jgi:hypothetical protein|nr:S46 family peptidase [Planctomycetaceae bacterium]